jgi:hypothetical protein
MATIASEAELKQAAEDLRAAKTQWAAWGYAAPEDETVKFLGSGKGGLEAAGAHAKEDNVVYICLAVQVAYAETQLTKYVLISWVGGKVKPKNKARSSPHRVLLYNQLNKFLALSMEYQALSPEEFTLEKVNEKMAGAKSDLSEKDLRAAALKDEAKRAPSASSEKAEPVAAPKAKPAAKEKAAAAAKPAAEESSGAMSFQFVNEAAVKEALANLKASKGKWALFGYQKDTGNIDLQGVGSDEDVTGRLQEGEVQYALLSAASQEGDFSTLKWLLATWVGPKVRPAQKAKSSVHRGELYRYINLSLHLHAELQASTQDELSATIIQQKLQGTRELASTKPSSDQAARAKGKSATVSGGDKVMAEEAEAKRLVEDLRGKASTGAGEWLLLGYKDAADANVTKLARGSGGVDTLRKHFSDDALAYGVLLAPFTDPDSNYTTNKFVFISWVGPAVKPMIKAKSSQQRFEIYQGLKPELQLAAEFQVLSADELSDQLITAKLAGTRAANLSEAPAAGASPAPTSSSAAKAKPLEFGLADEGEVKTALKELQTGKCEWVAFGYKNNADQISLLARGSGGPDQAAVHFSPASLAYAVFAVKESDEEYATVKRVFVSWVGASVRPTEKAKSSQHRLPLYKYINAEVALAAELQAEVLTEVTPALLRQKISGAGAGDDNTRRLANAALVDADKRAAKKPSPAASPAPAGKQQPATAASKPKAEPKAKAEPKGKAESKKEAVEFADEAGATAALQDCRDDSTNTDWVAFSSEDGIVKVSAKGGGGLQGLQAALQEDRLAYVVLRVQLKDADEGKDFGYTTWKFLFVSWVGPKVKPMLKAKSSQERLPIYK